MSAEMNANDPDLSEFRDHGGKLLVYSGTCDGMVPYPDAAQYVDRVYENTADAASFLRYFIVPGRDHSIQGTGVNSIGGSSANLKSMLDILRKWCENGEAPDILVGERIENDKVNFSVEIPCYVPGSLEYPEACDTSYLEK